MQLTIEKLVYGGDGLARVASPDGRRQAVFVPFTLPGEVVEAELERPAGGRVTARVVEILRPAPERIAARCEYFERCGGCQLQHAGAEYQLELKRGILLETLQRTGGVTAGQHWSGEVTTHAGAPWGYRNRIRLRRTPEGIGYTYRGSHHLLPVTHCPIASPALERALAELAAAPAEAERTEIELAANNRDEGLHSDEPLEFELAGHRYRVSAGAFFQVNRFLTGDLVEVVTAKLEGTEAVDLFSGVGLFALPLGRRFTRVDAVESNPAAFADLRHNAAEYSAVRPSRSAALPFLQRRRHTELDLLVADPPRAGLGPEMVGALLEAAPRRLHLVSCDPSTLGRDLRGLLAGGYTLEEVHLFDLFPQTYHLETVAKLMRTS